MQNPLYYLLLGFVVGLTLGATVGTLLAARAAMRDLTKLAVATDMLVGLVATLAAAARPLKPEPPTDSPSLRRL